MSDIKHFEAPIWFEPADLRRVGDLYITARYLPEGRSPDPCYHLDAKHGGSIGPNDVGTLLIDLWATDSTDERVASMLFDIGASRVTVSDGYVRGDHKGVGLPHMLVSSAQNLTGWNRGVADFQYLLVD